MTRRIALLAGLLGAAAVAVGVTNVLEPDAGPPAAQSLPSAWSLPSAPPLVAPEPRAGSGSANPGNEEGDLDGETVPVDSAEPAVTRLDPALLAALRGAAREAAEDGIEVRVSSGWRSKDYQQRLLDEAIATYGSRDEALRWVSTPDTSAHTTGHAVDVSPTDASYWMSEHGADFGLCQTYANEIWHYELLADPGGRCPPMLADSRS